MVLENVHKAFLPATQDLLLVKSDMAASSVQWTRSKDVYIVIFTMPETLLNVNVLTVHWLQLFAKLFKGTVTVHGTVNRFHASENCGINIVSSHTAAKRKHLQLVDVVGLKAV